AGSPVTASSRPSQLPELPELPELSELSELSEAGRLADRRFVTTGHRAYEVGVEDGSYPATGWHIRGEMGGFWAPPIKLLDGLWFAVDGRWLKATRFTSAPGLTRMEFAAP